MLRPDLTPVEAQEALESLLNITDHEGENALTQELQSDLYFAGYLPNTPKVVAAHTLYHSFELID